MREIIFRGKTADENEWIYGDIFHSGAYPEITRIHDYTNRVNYAINPETIGEFTGMTDKNGVKIFEGDIVKIYDSYDLAHDDVPDYHISKVFYYDGALCVEHYCSDYDFTVIGWIEDVEYEVIGNIYDSPEILGGDDNAAD